MAAFFSMGGYAAFVWSAYGLALLTLIGLAFSSWRRLRQLERRIVDLRADRPRRARPAATLPEEIAP